MDASTDRGGSEDRPAELPMEAAHEAGDDLVGGSDGAFREGPLDADGADGRSGRTCFDAAREFSGLWTNRTPCPNVTHEWLAPTNNAVAVYDAARDRVAVFPNDGQAIWEWAATSTLWDKIMPCGRGEPWKSPVLVVYDQNQSAVTAVVVATESSYNVEVWQWSGSEWKLPKGGKSPFSDAGYAAYDSKRKRVVLLGTAEVTEWDSASGVWSKHDGDATWPQLRSFVTLYYDTARDRIVAMGRNLSWKQEVWEWDSDGLKWTNRTPSSPPASWPDWVPHVVFDESRGVGVGLGSRDASDEESRDVFEWNGTTGEWTNRTPEPKPKSWPMARGVYYSLAYDSVRKSVLLIGGSQTPPPAMGGAELRDVWEWDGAAGTFTDLTPRPLPAPEQPRRSGYARAFDQVRGSLITFGGSVDGKIVDQTREWCPGKNEWTALSPVTRPSARSGAAMSYDRDRGKMVLTGGYSPSSGASLNDTWEWDDLTGEWLQRAGDGAGPRRRSGAGAFVYDSERKRAVLYGGVTAGNELLNDLWEWDGEAGAWIERLAPLTPRPRSGSAVVYDSVRHRLVVYGGESSGPSPYVTDLWEWDGDAGTWTERSPGMKAPPWPTGRIPLLSGFDGVRGRVTVFFGFTGSAPFLRDVWEWDGAAGTWMDRTPAVLPFEWPEPSQIAAFVLDEGSGLGFAFDERGRETWEWNGSP